METGINIYDFIHKKASEIKAQVIILKNLGDIFSDFAEQLSRHDQIAYLNGLKARILIKIQNIRQLETAAEYGHTKAKMISGAAAFGIGSLVAAISGKKDPIITGINVAKNTSSKNIPFGSIIIAIGKKGIPEDLKIIPLSRLARESKTSEENVRTTLKKEGYVLLTFDRFEIVLDKLVCNIKQGLLSLPIDEVGLNTLMM